MLLKSMIIVIDFNITYIMCLCTNRSDTCFNIKLLQYILLFFMFILSYALKRSMKVYGRVYMKKYKSIQI